MCASPRRAKTGPRFIVIGVAGLVVGIILILVSRALLLQPDGIYLGAVLRDFGIALLIAALVALTISYFEVRQIRMIIDAFVTDLRRDIMRARYGRVIPEQVSKEIETHILGDDILYESYEITGILDEMPGGKFLKGQFETEWTVRNLSDRETEFPIKVFLIDITSIENPNQNTISRIRVTNKDAGTAIFDWGTTELLSHSKYDDAAGRFLFESRVPLEKGQAIHVRVSEEICVKTRDYYSAVVLHPTIDGMSIRLRFPAGYKQLCTFNHPGARESRVCTFDDKNPSFVTAVINGGILPHHGITIDWFKPVTVDSERGLAGVQAESTSKCQGGV